MSIKRISVIVVLLACLIPSAALAITVNLGKCTGCTGTCYDSKIWALNPNNNYGASVDGNTGSFVGEIKGLMRFPLDTLPANIYVSSATLTIQVSAVTGAGESIGVYGVADANNGWVEGVTNAPADDATDEHAWNWLAYNETGWIGSAGLSTAGVDYYTPYYGSNAGTSTGTKVITLSQAGRDYVRRKAGSAGGVEFLLATIDTINSGDFVTWLSSDHATAATRPKLTIIYELNYSQVIVTVTY